MTTRISVTSARELLGDDPALPTLVVNARTGEVVKVVAYGPDWLDVVRCGPVERWTVPTIIWLLVALSAWGAMQLTDALIPTLVLFVVQIGCMVAVVRRIAAWLRRADW